MYDLAGTEGHELHTREFGVSLNEAKSQAAQGIPLSRLATADDIAKAIVWFASSESDHLIGQALMEI